MNSINRVYQDSFGERGTCYSACLASLLSLELKDVPRFVDLINHIEDDEEATKEWDRLVREFLFEHGYEIWVYEDWKYIVEWSRELDDDYHYIMVGKSPRSDSRYHAVIYNKDKPAHDPNPEGTFLVESSYAHVLVEVEDES